jgi:hypothetical protein
VEGRDARGEGGSVQLPCTVQMLLFGCESWSLTQRLRDKLRTFHRGCVRDMCRLNMWHVQQYRITAHRTWWYGWASDPSRPTCGAAATPVAWACATHVLAPSASETSDVLDVLTSDGMRPKRAKSVPEQTSKRAPGGQWAQWRGLWGSKRWL